MKLSDPSNTFVSIPFLKVGSRVHFDDLEERGPHQDDVVCFYNDALFDGIAWYEYEGCIKEYTYKNGLKHGRAVSVNSAGRIVEDLLYSYDSIVGDLFKWYDSGAISHHENFDSKAKKQFERHYSENGTLLKEIDERGEFSVMRTWTKQGDLFYENDRKKQSRKYFSPDGLCIMEVFSVYPPEDCPSPIYDEQALYENVSDMIQEKPKDHFKYDVRNWINTDTQYAQDTLLKLLKHPLFEIAELALWNIKSHHQEALPIVQHIAKNGHPQDHKANVLNGPLSHQAKIVLKTLQNKSERKIRAYQGRLLFKRIILEKLNSFFRR